MDIYGYLWYFHAMSLTRMFTAGMAKNWVHFLRRDGGIQKLNQLPCAQWLSNKSQNPPVVASCKDFSFPSLASKRNCKSPSLGRTAPPDITRYHPLVLPFGSGHHSRPTVSACAEALVEDGPRCQNLVSLKMGQEKHHRHWPIVSFLANGCPIFRRTWMVPKQFLKQLHVLSEGSAKDLETLGRTGADV